MTKQIELLTQMSSLVDALIDNASQLNEVAKRTSSHAELDPLQHRQQEIISQLGEIDIVLKRSVDEGSKEEISFLRRKVHLKLAAFQKINEEFLSHVAGSFRLI